MTTIVGVTPWYERLPEGDPNAATFGGFGGHSYCPQCREVVRLHYVTPGGLGYMLAVCPADHREDVPDLMVGKLMLQLITSHPEVHFQATWIGVGRTRGFAVADPMLIETIAQEAYSCGTTACAAGWAALLSGAQIVDGELQWEGKRITVEAFATAALGLSFRDAVDLFLNECGKGQSHAVEVASRLFG